MFTKWDEKGEQSSINLLIYINQYQFFKADGLAISIYIFDYSNMEMFVDLEQVYSGVKIAYLFCVPILHSVPCVLGVRVGVCVGVWTEERDAF